VVSLGAASGRQPDSARTYQQKICSFHSAEEFQRLTGGKVILHRGARYEPYEGGWLIGTEGGVVWEHRNGKTYPFPGERLPDQAITVIAQEAPGIYWFGTARGAVMYRPDPDAAEMRYFVGKRWLPDDRVTALGFETSKRVVWIETPKGYSRIEYKPITLAEKAKLFAQRIRARHVRHGFVADSRLRVPGDLSTNQPVSTDNDGLWTAIYIAAEAFRYKVTGETEARDFARQSLQALMRLEAITGIPGFPARSFIKIGEDEQPADGEWHTTSDGQWRWKGDTSSDEIVGHYFAYAVYHDLVADENEKRQIRAVVDRITSHIVDNGYRLIDTDGKQTRWGWWGPEAVWEDPDETGLRALHILSHLRVAHHITGNPKYQAAYDELINKHRYHLLTRNQKINVPGRVNHSDDELAFLSYYPLLVYEKAPKLVEVYRQSLERSWQVERPERNPLWNFIYAVGSGSKEYDVENSVRTLREIPMDLITWTVTNSHRLDVPLDPLSDRFKRAQSLTVLPYDELPVMKWNGNPYRLDGGDGGRGEDDGAYFLLPYWMGRYHKLVAE
jgi:hypothetical protein